MTSPLPTESQSEATEYVTPKTTTRNDVGEIFSFFKTLAIFFVAAFFLKATVVEAFKIPSGSMIPTLRIGDHILVSKFAYGLRLPFMTQTAFEYGLPKRGDIVVFTRPDDLTTPEDESETNIIKRVIGLPGDQVEVRHVKVYINNEPYTEPYARWEEGGIAQGNFGPETVPPNHIFLLGDNRDHSRDSRFWTDDPFLDISRIKGRALIVYWSWDSMARIGNILK